MPASITFGPTDYALIHLADDEWGNEKMQQIAEAFFADNPTCQFVEVSEHAGWFLGFRRDGTIWTTANDMAKLNHPRPLPDRLTYAVRRGPDGHEYPLGRQIAESA